MKTSLPPGRTFPARTEHKGRKTHSHKHHHTLPSLSVVLPWYLVNATQAHFNVLYSPFSLSLCLVFPHAHRVVMSLAICAGGAVMTALTHRLIAGSPLTCQSWSVRLSGEAVCKSTREACKAPSTRRIYSPAWLLIYAQPTHFPRGWIWPEVGENAGYRLCSLTVVHVSFTKCPLEHRKKGH